MENSKNNEEVLNLEDLADDGDKTPDQLTLEELMKPSKQRTYYIDGIYYFGRRIRIYVDNHMFNSYTRDAKAEMDRRDCETRCHVEGERGLKRCTEDCANCPFGKDHRDGGVIPLDYLKEEYGIEPSSGDCDPAQAAYANEVEEAYESALRLMCDLDRKVWLLSQQGLSSQEIAGKIGKSQTGVSKMIRRLTAYLQEKLRNFI